MILLKNVASQKIPIFAWDAAAGTPKTGDAANITAYVKNDSAAAASFQSGGHPTEEDATNMPGIYYYFPTQAQTNYNQIELYPESTTANVIIRPVIINTTVSLYIWKRTA